MSGWECNHDQGSNLYTPLVLPLLTQVPIRSCRNGPAWGEKERAGAVCSKTRTGLGHVSIGPPKWRWFRFSPL